MSMQIAFSLCRIRILYDIAVVTRIQSATPLLKAKALQLKSFVPSMWSKRFKRKIRVNIHFPRGENLD